MEYTIWLQILMELVFAVSGEMELKFLLKKAEKGFLSKLDCIGFLIFSWQKSELYLEEFAPNEINEDRSLMNSIIPFASGGIDAYKEEKIGRKWVYFFQLKNYGVMVLIRNRIIEEKFLLELIPIVDMFTVNILGCIAFKKQIETEKKLSRERVFLRKLIDTIPDVIFYKNIDGRYVLANKACEKFLDIDIRNIEGATDYDIHPYEEAIGYIKRDSEIMKNNAPVCYETVYRNYMGEDKLYEVSLTPLEEYSIMGILGVGRDITKRKETEDIVKRSLEFEDILMNLSLKFINIESSNTEQAINEALETVGEFIGIDKSYLFEYDFKEDVIVKTNEWSRKGVEPSKVFLGKVPIEIFSKDIIERHKTGNIVLVDDVENLKEEEKIYSELKSNKIKSLLMIPIMDGKDAIGFLGFDTSRETKIWSQEEISLLMVLVEIFKNAKLKKKHEKELIESKKMAETANRAKGNFLANMSHEIRTPLNGIASTAYLLNEMGISEEQKYYLSMMNESVEVLKEIIDNILDFSKLESGKLKLKSEKFNLKEEILKICKIMSLKAEARNIKLLVNYPKKCPEYFSGDRVRIRQIIFNLLGNSIKFTRDGNVTVDARYLDNNLIIRVIDTGIGISTENQKIIFQGFTQVEEDISKRFEGTGLGLSITNEILKLMDGEIKVKSKIGVGSTFEVKIPL